MFDEGYARQEFSRHPVDDVIETVPVRPAEDQTLRAADRKVGQDRVLGRIPIVVVVRTELEMPGELARARVQRNHAVREQIVAGTYVGVEIRSRIADAPIH